MTGPLVRQPSSSTKDRGGSSNILVLYLGFIGAWLFDFQAGASGVGVAVQGVFLAIFAVFGLLFFFADRAAAVRIPGLSALLVVGLLYLLVAVIGGLANGQGAYPIARNALTVGIYLAATYATARVVAQTDPRLVRMWLGRLCLGFVVAGFGIGLATSARSLDTVRYQIIGGSITAGLAFLAVSLLFRVKLIEWASFLFSFFVTFASITRTYVLVMLVPLIPLLRYPRVIFTGRFVVVGIAALVVAIGVIGFGDIGIERWIGRLATRSVDRGIDPTTYARLSEWSFMYDAWTASISQFLFGNGIAAITEYYVPSGYSEWLESSIGFGHNQYLSLLFTGGLIGGLPLILVQLHHCWRSAVLLARVAGKAGDGSWHLLMLTTWGAVIVLGVMVANSLGSTFVNRGYSLWFGIGTGLLLGGQACFLAENRHILAAINRLTTARP